MTRETDEQPSGMNEDQITLLTSTLSPIREGDADGHLDRNLEPGVGNHATKTHDRRPVCDGPVESPLAPNQGAAPDDPHGAVAPTARRSPNGDVAAALKLSPEKLQDLVTSPDSLPLQLVTSLAEIPSFSNGLGISGVASPGSDHESGHGASPGGWILPLLESVSTVPGAITPVRPSKPSRSATTPLLHRKESSTKSGREKPELSSIKTGERELSMGHSAVKPSPRRLGPLSPLATVMPIPPLSLPTYLQLELSSERPSELYLHRPAESDAIYESSKVKFDRLMNFLLLPPSLEQVLWFGAVACLDAWLYTFTILPLRFLKAVAVLARWWAQSALVELGYLCSFVYCGVGRVWQRRGHHSASDTRRASFVDDDTSQSLSVPGVSIEGTPTPDSRSHSTPSIKRPRKTSTGHRHYRTRSKASALLPDHKADILQGLLILAACYVLMWFDASRIYHSIRGQSAIKLYVIYNVLEVFDRLFSALGQDILECLFSKETLERDEKGRSKLTRPFWLWILALVYVVIHSTALFYQVVTLNVAVNSYSNALLTLLMSNQFVEIKGTVFKKFEKENLFQLTCADIVERFQLWLMLLIIAVRNIFEVGGLSMSAMGGSSTPAEGLGGNIIGIPLASGFVIPSASTLLPKWTGEVLGPFLIVLGSEALVDWCKHAYIGKFNNVKPNIYDRFLDVLAKDYYSHAFVDQNLTKRLGLPVIPLSCLFMRACVQTYHMFLATHALVPLPSMGTSVSLDTDATTISPTTTAALRHVDEVFRRALGRSTFGAGSAAGGFFSRWSIDDAIAFGTMITVFLALFLILLSLKLLLGMLLLSYARNRCSHMEERERQSTVNADGKRAGIGALTEVDESKRKWIYHDDMDGLRVLKEKEQRGRKQNREKGDGLEAVDRYMMAAKRIW
ncbi:hypothetical protein LTR91_000440 [Friedmanniomyces endolithicus]|uniref:DUF747-domain-containing protein n=2 Tax=Friedmanniomyces endolithicus TaxID=329885 RepID=A0AAN6FV95_9PEZI|nr:hypothetical protein LTS09_015557 [Friedmanniomyces endolithicus]KAK0277103.1 hypothetical protein LTR35_010013 [Friedmanniomyces endolithicus]KAK0298231.1 hypothetical protein LTS00_003196 [Friedmanniomyces endolithicus]KAK0313652.1 hypothetical protein LTR01_001909 [Friedmanniomyces endolithicus]KAK0323887.1 hypothetical protein LTR82_005007 [Friedmanniomyces endolithicus]